MQEGCTIQNNFIQFYLKDKKKLFLSYFDLDFGILIGIVMIFQVGSGR